MNFNDVAIVYVKGIAYKIHFWYMSKNDAISIMNNSKLTEKKMFCNFFITYEKWVSLLNAIPLNATQLKKFTIKETEIWY